MYSDPIEKFKKTLPLKFYLKNLIWVAFWKKKKIEESFGARKIGSLKGQMVKLRTHEESHYWALIINIYHLNVD